MRAHHRSPIRFRPSVFLVLLAMFLASLWVAGGASRADASGQMIVRATAALAMVVAILFGDRDAWAGSPRRWGAAGWFLLAAILLAVAQLLPLPPGLWQALPGRALLTEAASASGQAQPWRPWSMVPSATANALASLIVPATTLVLVGGLREEERRWLPGVLLAFGALAMFLGLLQFSGGRLDNPLINDTVGEVSGPLANRNHFALLLAIGCLLAPVWAFSGGRPAAWRGLVALGCVLLFALMILATGSRAGILLGMLSLAGGVALVWREVRRLFRGSPRWLLPSVVAAVVGLVAILGLVSFAADRAVSISRVLAIDPRTDIRGRALSTVVDMTKTYFPAGTGLGSFDQAFRLHEPAALLKPTFFNHAHNDYLETMLTAGLPGLLLLLAALGWWAWASLGAWRQDARAHGLLPRLGSGMLGLVLIASLFDYPARTPVIMAMVVIGCVWLDNRGRPSGVSFTRS